jgi:hypothetical protein
MSETQISRLNALLERVQQNRQRPGSTKSGAGDVVNASSTAQGLAAPAAAPRLPPEPPRLSTPSARSIEPPAAKPPSVRPPPAPDPRREPPARVAPRPPQPAPLAADEIVPRIIEADPPREAGRPIAQVVSKHAQPVDATFGAMLKRSLSLRPH